MRITRATHFGIGAAAALLALAHIFCGGPPGVAVAVLVPGLCMAASARSLGGGAVLATAALALVSMCELFFLRATMPAVFTVAAGVDALLLSLHLGHERRWAGFAAAMVLCAIVAIGFGDAMFVALPIDP
jgi:hypothetical protein